MYKRTDNTRRIQSTVRNRKGLAIRFMLEDIHRRANPNTPKLTGELRSNVVKRVQGSRGSISWRKHYAAYQERGYTSGKVRRYTTPGTGAHFAEEAVRSIARNGRTYFRKAGL